MKIQVVVTRTDAGATTKLITNNGESSKNYASWDDALKEAQDLKLISTVEATALKPFRPGFRCIRLPRWMRETLPIAVSFQAKRHHLNKTAVIRRDPGGSAPPTLCILPLRQNEESSSWLQVRKRNNQEHR
jgi:hypothetical protein